MGCLEDDLTDYARMHDRDKRIASLEAALCDTYAAIKDVMDHWSDPGSYTHNRLLTPLLVHEETFQTTLKR
jgi:hypothetical protein